MSATKLQDEPTPYVRSIASEVNAQMARKGRMRATQLAAATGLPYRTLARCLAGDRPFAVNELERIAVALGCEVRDFIPDRGVMKSSFSTPPVGVSRFPGQRTPPRPRRDRETVAA